MEESVRVTSTRYQMVAVDIAAKIVNREYQVGEKIYARSSLASQYSVSPETARRAIAILVDLNIVEATKGSGVVIKSCENAQKFLKQFRGTQTVAECKRDVVKRLDQFISDGEALRDSVSRLVEYTNKYRHNNPFSPFEQTVDRDSASVGQSLSELNFWQNTGATVVAIRRGDVLTLSPGPYMDLQTDDILYFVGDESTVERVFNLIGRA